MDKTKLRFAATTFAAVCLLVMAAPRTHAMVTFDWAVVGNAGNVADSTGFGAVSYAYQISRYEVTNDQYAEFLNAVEKDGAYGLYHVNMGSQVRGGITRSGSSGNYTYVVKQDMGNKPVNFVSLFDAMRFVNWLHNGQGSGATETGVYNMSLGLADINAITRAAGATHFIPTVDEWYKAAYHQPASQGGDSDDYWSFPTRSNSVPLAATATLSGDMAVPGTNIANFNNAADWNGQDGNLTTVGSAGLGSASYYGTFDQGGNVWEWNETITASASGANRGVRGGGYSSGPAFLQAIYQYEYAPGVEFTDFGFRVAAALPEPSTLVLLIVTPVFLRRRYAQR